MVDKITTTQTVASFTDKINEIIDNLGGLSYSATNSSALSPSNGVCTWSVTHNLGSSNVIVSLYLNGAEIEKNVAVTSANALTVSFAASSSVSAGVVKIVVIASVATADTSNLANINLSNLSATGNKVLDGQWVASHLLAVSETSLTATTPLEISLAQYLPNDNYNYEVLVSVVASSDTTSAHWAPVYVGTDITDFEYIAMCAFQNVNAAKAYFGGACVLPFGTGRKLYVTRSSSYYTKIYEMHFTGYRRIGTNS